jgi:hypothetical protein
MLKCNPVIQSSIHPAVKVRIAAAHFLTKTLPKLAAEMALSVFAYDLTRVMIIMDKVTAHGGAQVQLFCRTAAHLRR